MPRRQGYNDPMGRVFSNLLVLALIIAAAFVFRDQIRVFTLQGMRTLAPCSVPITYSIGAIDPRFHLSTSTAQKALAQAAEVWSKGAGKTLLERSDHGELIVNFVYDTRQATTLKLKTLGITVQSGLDSYNAVKSKYDSAVSQYTSAKQRFDAQNAGYESAKAAYEAEVRKWNARGGAPQNVYDQLSQERDALQGQALQLQQLQTEVNSHVDDINALVPVLNQLAQELNLSVDRYNTVGESTGSEFEEAVYESAAGRESISVFEYDSALRLQRVLEREFGHALGLEHVDDPAAIMYRLNKGANSALTKADVSALKALCRL